MFKKKCVCGSLLSVSLSSKSSRASGKSLLITATVIAKNESPPKCSIVDFKTPVLMPNDFFLVDGKTKYKPVKFAGYETASQLPGVAVTNQFSSAIEMEFVVGKAKSLKLVWQGIELGKIQ